MYIHIYIHIIVGTVTDKMIPNLKNIKFEKMIFVFENFQKSWSRPTNKKLKKLTIFKLIKFDQSFKFYLTSLSNLI
jgi:hypothetical protein